MLTVEIVLKEDGEEIDQSYRDAILDEEYAKMLFERLRAVLEE